MFRNFYPGRRVLITGHTGFKGAWLALWLQHLGSHVAGFSLDAPSQPALASLLAPTCSPSFHGDITDPKALTAAIDQFKPELIFHLAAQSLVRKSYRDPLPTVEVNCLGAVQLLETLRRLECPATVLVVTSDKCYENTGRVHGYREDDALGGHDIYSASKAATEILTHAWRRSFFDPNPRLGAIVSARAGNVIGGGDFAEDRLLPDCARALAQQRTIEIRNPNATRPWQHVLDCLSGYLWLAALAATSPKGALASSAFNFGPGPESVRTVREVVESTLQLWPGAWSHPPISDAPHEARALTLTIDLAVQTLNWRPTWTFPSALAETIHWYRDYFTHPQFNPTQTCLAQIERFTQAARQLNLRWTQPAP